MSMFSGKCDLFDIYCGIPESEEKSLYEIQHTKFIVDGKDREINSIKELVPFFPCISGMSSWSGGEKGSGICHFSSRSYVLSEHDERMGYRFKDAKRAYRKLKRKKEKITPETLYNSYYHWGSSLDENGINPIDMAICKALAYEGEDVYISNFSVDRFGSIERKHLYDVMIEYGYTNDQAIGWVYENDIKALDDPNYSL